MVPLSYLSVFWRSLELSLINGEINLILTWPANCVIVSSNVANQNTTFAITDTKLYVPVVTLSTQNSANLLQKLKSGFKTVINWNKYLSKPELLAQNPNLNHLVEPRFQGVNRLFVLAFENDTQRTSAKGYYLRNVEIKNYNVIVNGETFFDQAIKNYKVTYENIRKICTGFGDDYTTGSLLDYPYFKDSYIMIAADLSKQQALDVDPRAIQQIKLLKATRNKKKKHNKIVMLARSKLNSIESKISEALINNKISHEDFITIINEERNYRDLKESIRIKK